MGGYPYSKMRTRGVILLNLLLVGSSFQKSLLRVGKKVTGTEIKACKGKDVLTCNLVTIDLSTFDDEYIELPGGRIVKKKNDIQDLASRLGFQDQAHSVAYEGADGGNEAVFSIRHGRVMG